MNKSILIIGGKPIDIDYVDILNKYDHICRINLNLKLKKKTGKDIFYVNNHINNFIVKQRLKPEQLKKYPYDFVELKVLKDFHDMLNNKEYSDIIEQYESGTNIKSNKILEHLKCPYKFAKAPRCGYQAVLHFITKGYKVDVMGFSYTNNKNITESCSKSVSNYHDVLSELKILYWLHNNNYIDATLCLIENKNMIPRVYCDIMKPSENILKKILNIYGIVILKNYYDNKIIKQIINEYDRIFKEHKDQIFIHKTIENINGDERIHNAQKFSDFIKVHFSYNVLFNNIAKSYNSRLYKKTLINKVKYIKDKVTNSGMGWHRDNHNCQFKAIMYLTDVTSKTGCFQWITNSSKKFIGKPKPRKDAYADTRFDNETIEQLVNKNSICNKIDIEGKKGTIILADTTYIHRGKIIEEGLRKAITEYFF